MQNSRLSQAYISINPKLYERIFFQFVNNKKNMLEGRLTQENIVFQRNKINLVFWLILKINHQVSITI